VVTFTSDIAKEGTQYKDGESLWVTECPQQELLDCYANWEPEVEQLLKVRYYSELHLSRRYSFPQTEN